MLAVRWKYRSFTTIRQPKPLPSIIMPSHINIPLLPSLPSRQTTYIFGIASRSFSDKIKLDRLTLDHDGLHMTGPPKRFDQPAWELSRGLLSHKLALATFEDNKIRSAELTSESDKFIHILYGVFYSWIYLEICASGRWSCTFCSHYPIWSWPTSRFANLVDPNQRIEYGLI